MPRLPPPAASHQPPATSHQFDHSARDAAATLTTNAGMGSIIVRRMDHDGPTARLDLACSAVTSAQPWLADFVGVTRESSFKSLPGIELL